MKYNLPLLITFLALTSTVFSQSLSPTVLSSAGSSVEGKTMRLDWTLGEIAVRTLRSGEGMLTEGFHQPVLKVEETEFSGQPLEIGGREKMRINLWPNPVSAVLTVRMESAPDEEVLIDIQNIWGKSLQRIISQSPADMELDMSPFPAGIYLLSFRTREGEHLKTFKVVKAE